MIQKKSIVKSSGSKRVAVEFIQISKLFDFCGKSRITLYPRHYILSGIDDVTIREREDYITVAQH